MISKKLIRNVKLVTKRTLNFHPQTTFKHNCLFVIYNGRSIVDFPDAEPTNNWFAKLLSSVFPSPFPHQPTDGSVSLHHSELRAQVEKLTTRWLQKAVEGEVPLSPAAVSLDFTFSTVILFVSMPMWWRIVNTSNWRFHQKKSPFVSVDAELYIATGACLWGVGKHSTLLLAYVTTRDRFKFSEVLVLLFSKLFTKFYFLIISSDSKLVP